MIEAAGIALIVGGGLLSAATVGFLVGFASAVQVFAAHSQYVRVDRDPGEPRKAWQTCTPIVQVDTAAKAAERN